MNFTAEVSERMPFAFELGRSPPPVFEHAVAAEGSSQLTFHEFLAGKSPSTFTNDEAPAAKALLGVVSAESA
jgi:hypothetical protein